MRRIFMVLGLILLGWSCAQPGGPVFAPLVDHTPAQRQIWSLAPEGATTLGVTLADFGHFLGRLQALRATAEIGPTGKKYVQQGMTEVQKVMGFDPLDAQAWRDRGIDTSGPVGAFMMAEQERSFFVVKATDPAKATAALTKIGGENGESNPLRCKSQGSWLVCGGESPAALASSEAASMWPIIAKNIPAADLGTEVGFYLTMDRGPVHKELASTENASGPDKYFAGSQGLWLGASLGEEQLVARGFYANPGSAQVAAYFRPDQGSKSILGVATGAKGVGRLFLSAKALWKLAQDSTDPRTMDQAQGAFQMTTGLDLKRDLVENLTGEIVYAGWNAKGLGIPDGSILLGTVDDERTRHVIERLDALAQTGLAVVQSSLEESGWKVTHTSEPIGGRPVFSYSAAVPPNQVSQMGRDHFELHFSTIPGALVVALGREGITRAQAGAGKPAEAFLAQLATTEARQGFDSQVAAAFWGLSENPFGGVAKSQWDAMAQNWSAVHPDAPDALREIAALADLLYDESMSFEIKPNGMHLFFQLTLL